MDVSQCQLLEEKAGEGKAATSLWTTSSTRARKEPRIGPAGGALGSCGNIVLITYGEGGQDNCIQRTVTASTAEPSGTN